MSTWRDGCEQGGTDMTHSKRAVILHQEWLSLLMPPPVEQKIVIFNLRNFGLRNME